MAWSGGRDSTVLLHALKGAGHAVRAVHVHHGLQDRASDFQRHCCEVAAQWDIPLVLRQVQVAAQGRGLEAAARDARYEALWSALPPDEILVTAHHAQDQAETLLARIVRGTGIEGLRGMRVFERRAQGRLWRPLLSVSPEALAAYAALHGVRWIDDPHNEDPRFERVWLRQTLLPMLRQRHPQVDQALSRLQTHAEDAADLLAPEIAARCDAAMLPNRRWGDALSIAALRAMPAAQRRAVLRQWWARFGHPAWPSARLAQIDSELLNARDDATPVLRVGPRALRRYRDGLYAVVESPPSPVSTWDDGRCCEIVGLGVWTADRPPQRPLSARFPQGADRIRLPGEAHHRKLKTLFQTWGVPPWLRARTPVLAEEGRLLAVAGFAIADDAPTALRWTPQDERADLNSTARTG